MRAVSLILITAVTSIGPLTDEQRIILETAYDGRDHKESAYIALVEHAATWTCDAGKGLEESAGGAVRLNPDLDAMIDDPDAYRGGLCRIAGRIEQQTDLPAPYDGAAEWFIRDERGRPILVYVVGSSEAESLDEGDPVEIFARFYKRVDAEARDGEVHRYPAFVGALPRSLTPAMTGAGELRHLWIVFAAIAIMLVALLLIMLRLRHGGRALPAPHLHDRDEPLDDGPPLPDDPANALDEMKRRAEDAP